jgi:hypothetical protein
MHNSAEMAKLNQTIEAMFQLERQRERRSLHLEDVRHEHELELEDVRQENRIKLALIRELSSVKRQRARMRFELYRSFLNSLTRDEIRVTASVILLEKMYQQQLETLCDKASHSIASDTSLTELEREIRAIETTLDETGKQYERRLRARKTQLIVGRVTPSISNAFGDSEAAAKHEELGSKLQLYRMRQQSLQTELEERAKRGIQDSLRPLREKIANLKRRMPWSELHDGIVDFMTPYA